jgi:hypothetical protein
MHAQQVPPVRNVLAMVQLHHCCHCAVNMFHCRDVVRACVCWHAGAQGVSGDPGLCRFGWTTVVASDTTWNDQSAHCNDVVTGNRERCATAQVGRS